MRKLFRFRHHKLIILILITILSYIIFSNESVVNYTSSLGKTFGYIGIFLAGFLFSFGFTAPISIGFFLTFQNNNIILASLIGSLGSVLSDYIIFKTIKMSFIDDFKRLEKTKIFKEINSITNHKIPKKLKYHLMYIFAGVLIATPLPDEFGVTMLAGLTHIKTKFLLILSFVVHFFGIFILLLI